MKTVKNLNILSTSLLIAASASTAFADTSRLATIYSPQEGGISVMNHGSPHQEVERKQVIILEAIGQQFQTQAPPTALSDSEHGFNYCFF